MIPSVVHNDATTLHRDPREAESQTKQRDQRRRPLVEEEEVSKETTMVVGHCGAKRVVRDDIRWCLRSELGRWCVLE